MILYLSLIGTTEEEFYLGHRQGCEDLLKEIKRKQEELNEIGRTLEEMRKKIQEDLERLQKKNGTYKPPKEIKGDGDGEYLDKGSE